MTRVAVDGVDNTANVLLGLQVKILNTIKKCQNKTRYDLSLQDNIMTIKIEVLQQH